MNDAWIISIGTELTIGRVADTNAAWLAERLSRRGYRVQRIVTVPDDLQAAVEVLQNATNAAHVVLLTGGLGPTADDITRQALAAAAGVELQLHHPSLEHLRNFFAQRGRPMHPQNEVQALLPQGADALTNNCGTAPGIALNINNARCFALPGVPFEMKQMYADAVQPQLPPAAEQHAVVRYLHCYGAGESNIGAQIKDLMARGNNPDIGTTAQLGVITIRIHATAETTQDANILADTADAEITNRLGPLVFGRDDDTPASALGNLLKQRNATLATAESCTGGLIGKLLTDHAGSSAFYLGGAISYDNDLKQRMLGVPENLIAAHGAVSEPVAIAMARGARQNFHSDYALSVTGIAGPTGGSPDKPVGLVYIGRATPRETTAHEFRFGTTAPRDVIRARAAFAALNLLRRALDEDDAPKT